MKLYLASRNPGKLRELSEGARACGLSAEPLPDLESYPLCREDGATFEENARKKAIHYSSGARGWVLAEDSGLSVDALEGAPGIHSARFAGQRADEAANNEKLLWEMRSFEAARRWAHYACVMALAEQGRVLVVTQGRADGMILEAPRGQGGFGYDPLFFFPPLGKTFAELSSKEKFRVSHRGEAFRKLLEYLKGIR